MRNEFILGHGRIYDLRIYEYIASRAESNINKVFPMKSWAEQNKKCACKSNAGRFYDKAFSSDWFCINYAIKIALDKAVYNHSIVKIGCYNGVFSTMKDRE